MAFCPQNARTKALTSCKPRRPFRRVPRAAACSTRTAIWSASPPKCWWTTTTSIKHSTSPFRRIHSGSHDASLIGFGSCGALAGAGCRGRPVEPDSQQPQAQRARSFSELGLGELLPLVDALPQLMTPASAALGVPALAKPGEGVGQGWASESTISGVSGRPQGEPYTCATPGMAGDSGRRGRLGVDGVSALPSI